MKQYFELVVFDIGGVLADLGGTAKFVEWTGLSADELKSLWLKLDVAREFELGNISFDKFSKKVINELKLPLSSKELHSQMERWATTLFPNAESIVHQVKTRVRIACLSNSNSIQWPILRDKLGIGSWFQDQFISYEMGKIKPDKEAYEAVTEKLGIDPEKVIFFDDSKDNIEGAIKAGWSSYLVQGTTELTNQLKRLNLI